MNDQKRGLLFVMGAAVFWGTYGLYGHVLLNYGLSPIWISFIRSSVAFAFLIILLSLFDRSLLKIELRDIPFFAFYGLIGITCFYSLYLVTIQLVGVTMAVMLMYTSPAWVMMFSAMFLGEGLTAKRLLALLLTLIGCFLIVKAYHLSQLVPNLLGIVTGIGSGITYALYSIFGKKGSKRYSTWTVMLYSFGFGSIFLGVLSQFASAEVKISEVTVKAWVIIFLMALIPTLAAYWLYITSLKHLPASVAGVIATLEPVVATLLAILFLGERLEVLQIAGMLSVIGAGALLQYSKDAKQIERKVEDVRGTQN